MMGGEQIKRYELQTLRTFRDTWMKGSKEGQNLLRLIMIQHLKLSLQSMILENLKAIYEEIYNEMILSYVQLIEQNKMQESFELYKEKVFELKKLYLLKKFF